MSIAATAGADGLKWLCQNSNFEGCQSHLPSGIIPANKVPSLGGINGRPSFFIPFYSGDLRNDAPQPAKINSRYWTDFRSPAKQNMNDYRHSMCPIDYGRDQKVTQANTNKAKLIQRHCPKFGDSRRRNDDYHSGFSPDRCSTQALHGAGARPRPGQHVLR